MGDTMYWVHRMLLRAQLFLGSFGLAGNALVCLTIIKTKSLHSVTNYMLLNLAMADALVSAFVFTEPTISQHFRWNIYPGAPCSDLLVYSFAGYLIIKYVQTSLTSHSVLCLTLATFERYIGIIKPLHYPTFFSKRKLAVLLLVAWTSPFLIELYSLVFYIDNFASSNCTIPTMATHRTELVADTTARFVLLFIMPTLTLTYMYVRILLNLKKGARNLEQQGIQGPPQELHRAHKKVTQSLVLVIAAFFLFLLPAVAMRNSTVYSNVYNGQIRKSETILKITALLTMFNSAINPILYGFKYRQLRRACLALICPFKRCKRDNQVQIIGGHRWCARPILKNFETSGIPLSFQSVR